MPEINLLQEIKATPASIFIYLTEQEFLAKWLTPAVIAFPKKGTFAVLHWEMISISKLKLLSSSNIN